MKTALIPTLALTLGLAGCAVAPPQPPSHNPLQGGEWRIDDMVGAGVIDNRHVALQFLAGHQLAGSGRCHRLLGVYGIAAPGKIAIDTSGSTRMACPKALMDQERTLLVLLPHITAYSVDATDGLQLSAPDERRITARRQVALP